MSQQERKLIEQTVGWGHLIGQMRHAMVLGLKISPEIYVDDVDLEPRVHAYLKTGQPSGGGETRKRRFGRLRNP
jgi:hypothetical protein